MVLIIQQQTPQLPVRATFVAHVGTSIAGKTRTWKYLLLPISPMIFFRRRKRFVFLPKFLLTSSFFCSPSTRSPSLFYRIDVMFFRSVVIFGRSLVVRWCVDREAVRQTDRKTDRKTGRQADRTGNHLPVFVEDDPVPAVHQLVQRPRCTALGARPCIPQLGLLRVGRLTAVHPDRTIAA